VGDPVRVGSIDDVAPGQPRLVEVHGTRVVLARAGAQVYACGDVCAHRGGPLSEGKLSGTRLACPWHGWMYDVRTGQCTFPGRGASVPSYPVRVDGGDIFVELP
jgi:nitrite reductase/ring-hydroxylating ferredoxin subunit